MKRKIELFYELTIAFLIVIALCIASCSTVNAATNNQVTIVIDPGHGGPATVDTNLGAKYYGLFEKDITLQTARALKAELETYGNVNVFLTRDEDIELSLKERIDIAKSVNADAVVSVHFNAYTNHLLYGSEIFVPSGPLYAEGYSMADSIMKQWVKDGMTDKGIKTRIGKNGDYYGLIRNGASSGIPTIILEHGYLDNLRDLDKLDESQDWSNLGKLDAYGIAKYFGLKKGVTQKNVTKRMSIKQPKAVVMDDVTPPVLALEINSYNKNTGELKYTLTATEPESRPYLYAMAPTVRVDEGGSVLPAANEFILWRGKNSVTGVTYLPAGYVGPINAICYNNYNLLSNLVTAYIGY